MSFTVQNLIDREEIRHLLATYTMNGDRGQMQAFAGTFAPDGILESRGEQSVGPEGIIAGLGGRERSPLLKRVRHHITPALIEISEDGQSATSRAYFFVVTNLGPDHSGTYVDKLKKLEGKWRFAHRQVRVDWQSPASLYPSFAQE